jgi:hypothetical protein
MMVKFEISLDSKKFENELRIFSSSLGGIFKELMASVGKEMAAEARSRARFQNRSGKLFNSINFIATDDGGVLTTRKSLNKPNVFYARFVEGGANIKAKRVKYLTFKINGEWKKVQSVNVRPRPFMVPTMEDFFGSQNSKGYQLLKEALNKKMEEYLK